MDTPPAPPPPARGPARGDRRLWAELLRRARRGQELRRRLPAAGGVTPGPDLVAELAAADADNTAWLAGVVAERGWPGHTLVGEDGAMAAWLLAQRADGAPEVQQMLLVALRRAAGAGEATLRQVAHLEDRVRISSGRPQLYGTQFRTADGPRPQPYEVEDPPNLGARRAAMGLEPPAGDAAPVPPPLPPAG